MYCETIEINNKKFIGTLDFWVLRKVQEDIEKVDRLYTIKQLFEKISDVNNIDMKIITSILYYSILRKKNEDDIEKEFMKTELDLEKFNSIFNYINSLLKKCMPLKNSVEKNLFEEEDLGIEIKEDWDFDYMEYIWSSVLNRNDFYSITPKNFFSQIKIYKNVNKIEDEEEITYL